MESAYKGESRPDLMRMRKVIRLPNTPIQILSEDLEEIATPCGNLEYPVPKGEKKLF